MTQVNADLVVLAVTVSVTKETDFSSIWSDFLYIDSELVLASSFLLPINGVLNHLIVKIAIRSCACGTKSAHDKSSLIN